MESILRYEDIYLEDEAAKSFHITIKDLNLDEEGGERPHVIVITENSYMGDGKISHVEVLTVCAVIMTQLEHEYLNGHYITPMSPTRSP